LKYNTIHENNKKKSIAAADPSVMMLLLLQLLVDDEQVEQAYVNLTNYFFSRKNKNF